jgi:hypothetical protein
MEIIGVFRMSLLKRSVEPGYGSAVLDRGKSLDGEARKIDGRWLLTRVSSSAVGIPVP